MEATSCESVGVSTKPGQLQLHRGRDAGRSDSTKLGRSQQPGRHVQATNQPQVASVEFEVQSSELRVANGKRLLTCCPKTVRRKRGG